MLGSSCTIVGEWVIDKWAETWDFWLEKERDLITRFDKREREEAIW